VVAGAALLLAGARDVVGVDVVWSGALLVVRGAVVVVRGAVVVGSSVVLRGEPVVLAGAVVDVAVDAGAWPVVVGAVVVGRASLGSAEFGTRTVCPLGRTTFVVPESGCGSAVFRANNSTNRQPITTVEVRARPIRAGTRRCQIRARRVAGTVVTAG
jgi:hypothetical protein